MSEPERGPIRLHEDAELFREAVAFTAARTGFTAGLIEKDYICTLILAHLAAAGEELLFKGGTALAKVHAGFYRLSEDLDFVLPTAFEARRGERSKKAAPWKRVVASIAGAIPGLTLIEPLQGSNASTQYNALIGYRSRMHVQQGTIQVEIGLREPLLTPATTCAARTLLLDPIGGTELIPGVPVRCLSRDEALAEKLRAALSRREAAIRDFFDVDHAVRHSGLRPVEPAFLDLVRRKLAVPGNPPLDVSPGRLRSLRAQIDAQLRPVLRPAEFGAFDLERAFQIVCDVAARLG